MSHRLHAHLRSSRRGARGPGRGQHVGGRLLRPLADRLTALADVAVSVGVERFVLDDGWFRGRRSDTAGLGDWTVDTDVWPEACTRSSTTCGASACSSACGWSPRWSTSTPTPRGPIPGGSCAAGTTCPGVADAAGAGPPGPGGVREVRDGLLALVDEYDIDYLKWDHNRDLTDATHDGVPAVHGQTLAAYGLLDELRAAHPALEIESCASGGGRVDAEVLTRTDRIWPSDTIDPLERQHLQRWTSLLVPPELIGSHVGGPTRTRPGGPTPWLPGRDRTALLLRHRVGPHRPRRGDARRAARWITLHKRVRPLSAPAPGPPRPPGPGGAGHRAGRRGPLRGVVRRSTVAATDTQHPAPLRLTGLDPDLAYRLTDEMPPGPGPGGPGPGPGGPGPGGADLTGAWSASGAVISGRVLATAGVALPVLLPEEARVLRVVAVG